MAHDVIDMRQRAAVLRDEAKKLEAEGKKAFSVWQSKGSSASSKVEQATRLEIAADMIEEAGEIAAGLRPVPISLAAGGES